MVVKSKESFGKTRHVKNNDKSKTYILRGQRKTRYHEKILSNKKKSHNITIVYFHDLVVYKKAFDISRKGSLPNMTPTPRRHHNITNHRVYLLFIISIQVFEYYLFLFNYLYIIVYSYSSDYWLLYNYTPCDL